MSKLVKALITAGVLGAFAAALYFSFSKTQQDAIANGGSNAGVSLPGMGALQGVELTGLIALDVEPYFKDPRVIKALAEKKLRVNATRIGSREMATRVVPGQSPDFFFPSGVVAANQVVDAAKKGNISATQSSPFYTPMVIASWAPIAGILQSNGMAKQLQPKVYGVDTAKLTQAMLAKKRWKDLQGASAYDVSKGVLVSTTDVRKSNSAAMYLALTSYAINGDVVTDRATANKVALMATELFKRQGYQENYVNGNFDDYVAIGMGKTPMAFIYENQLVAYALAKKGVAADMVLMYPQPTIINKVVFVTMNDKAKKLGELLANDPELQRIAVDYGFRIGDAAYFSQTVKATGLAIEERITQVIDPPSYDIMAEMIDVLTREMAQ